MCCTILPELPPELEAMRLGLCGILGRLVSLGQVVIVTQW